MKPLKKPLENLINLNHHLSSRFGSGLFTVLSIMAFLLVCCGLVTGMLGRGWLGAWFLVLLGLVLGIFPSVNLYETTFLNVPDSDQKTQENIPPVRPRIELDEATKKAIELEAALARKRILEKENARKEKLREEQEAREREAARIASIKYAEEQKRLKAAKRREFEQKERRERQQKNFNQDYFRQANVQKVTPSTPQKCCLSSEFFQGVTSAADLKKRYLDLLKIYHPDNASGDVKITQKLQAEYKELSAFFESYEKHLKK